MKVLQFSGGKDSLACLYLLEPFWDEITVVWVNTGAAFPETIEQMSQIRKLVPKFLEIESKQSIETEGYPADVLPVSSTTIGQYVEGMHTRKFQSRYACCASALWFPMLRAMRELHASVIYRGQKKCDRRKNTIGHGSVVDGVRYEYPLDDWTDSDVRTFLHRRGVQIPENYRYMNTGLDCWNCTAYLDENRGKMTYMREHHPDKHAHIQAVLSDLNQVLFTEMQPLRQIKADYQ